MSYMSELTDKKVLIVIAPKDFRDEEYFQPKVVLQAAGIEVVTAADSSEEEATGVQGGKARIDLPLSQVKVEDFDCVVFVGGPGTKIYFRKKEVLSLVKEFYKMGKIVGAICIAPMILANAKILEGRKAVVFPSLQKQMAAKGIKVTTKKIEISDKVITAVGPEVALEFGQKLVDLLKAANKGC